MTRTARARAVLDLLRGEYPEARIAPSRRGAFRALVCVVLSAQTTDRSVDRVAPALFRRFPGPAALARADVRALESLIRSIGLYRTKARNIKALSRMLVGEFNGRVPRTMEELTRLPGVGRKSANVVLPRVFGVPGLAVDTHVTRLAGLLGLSRGKDPARIERDLCSALPPRWWDFASLALILHGRRVCRARRPACPKCVLRGVCPSRRC